MKNISIYIAILLSALIFSSCDDYLTKNSPDQATTDQVWVSKDAVRKYLMGAYRMISRTGWRYHEYYYIPQNFRGDDMFPESGTLGLDYIAPVCQFTNTAATETDLLWYDWYRGLKLTNDVIENVPSMSVLTEDEQNELVAEGRFLRAFFLFNLQKNFYSIVMPLSIAKSTGDMQLPVSTREEVYKQIDLDFSFAAEHLPNDRDEDNWGRATSKAAYAFLGKARLFNNQNDLALQAFNKITGASLLSGAQYRSMFDGTNERNDEVLFSRGYTNDQVSSLYLGNNLAIALAPNDNDGWHMASVSDYYINQLAPNDVRKEASVLTVGDYNMSIKFIESPTSFGLWNAVDMILMRYADVILMKAEAQYAEKEFENARNNVNDIRERAGLPRLETLAGTALRDEIRKQRLLELVGEGHRFYDLVRWGIAKEQLATAKHPFAANIQEKHNYIPIPQGEAQRNTNIDPTPGF